MHSRLFKTTLCFILCFALVPLSRINLAWADEAFETTDSSDQDTTELDDTFNLTDLIAPVIATSFTDPAAVPAAVPVETTALAELAAAPSQPYSIEYRAHVANIGWQSWLKDGETAGTSGRSLAVEALNIKLNGTGLTGSVEYRLHVSNIGWQNWVKDGALSGTTGRALQSEAVSIRLTKELAIEYDVYYRVHVRDIGWMGWVKNGADAGTVGLALRMEAIEIQLVEKGGDAPGSTGTPSITPSMSLISQAHVQDVGWQNWTAEGGIAGTTGWGLRMEALCLVLSYPELAGSVEYRANVSGVGWQGWKSNGAMAGTTGQSRQMEAIQVRLTGEMATKYDVYYRVHVANLGWLDWAKNSETAGTVGLFFRMEAVQVKLVVKGEAAPGPTTTRSYEISTTSQANVAGSGWLAAAGGQATVGTTGQARQLEAFKISVSSNVTGGIEYQAFIQGEGWQSWVANGAVMGMVGQNKQIEAIRIRLTGNLATCYDVYYRAHSENWGWLGWAANGEPAGTGKVNLRMEAFQIAIVLKGAPAPGSTYGSYWEGIPTTAGSQAMNARVASVYSPTGWLIAIDSTNCLFGVYSGSQNNWSAVFIWPCSPGKASTPTPKGLFSIGSRGYVFGSGYSCYWWTQFYGNYLIHSLLYYPGTDILMEDTMGRPASDGCVRLDIQNAKWVYDNIPTGTTVLSY